MKNLWMALLVLLLASCLKDKGNYEYSAQEDITITGISESYTVISGMDTLKINPQISSSENGADFDYLWGIYETNVQGYAPVLDTLMKTKNLNYLVTQPAKGWVLVFRVTNKRTGYSKFISSNINVVTPYTRGWYVAKSNGDSTDADLFLTPNTIMPESVSPNVFSKVNGKRLAGKPLIMNFYTDYKSMVTGTLGNTRTLFLVTDKDASAVNINTFLTIRGIDQLFYAAPDVKKPGFVCNGSQALYFMNNGALQSIYSMSANSGQFGVRKMIDDKNSSYTLSKYFLTSSLSNPYFFDEQSSSFVSASGSGAMLTSLTDAEDTQMSANNNNKSVIYMGYKSVEYSPIQYKFFVTGYAVMADKTDPNLKIISKISPDGTKLKLENDTLKTSDKIFNAVHYNLLINDENLLYFTTGNQVWSRNLSNGFEQLQYTVPAGEEITFIRHRKSTESNYAYNYVMVGSTAAGKYKVRMFGKSSGNLNTAPDFVLEGDGIVGDVMYVYPTLSGYDNSY